MIHFERHGPDLQSFWHVVAERLTVATDTDMYSGRDIFGVLSAAGVKDIKIDYIVVDTIRVPRELFASMLEAWRDGFVDVIAKLTPIPRAEVTDCFANMIDQVRDPKRYAAWMVPVASARVR